MRRMLFLSMMVALIMSFSFVPIIAATVYDDFSTGTSLDPNANWDPYVGDNVSSISGGVAHIGALVAPPNAGYSSYFSTTSFNTPVSTCASLKFPVGGYRGVFGFYDQTDDAPKAWFWYNEGAQVLEAHVGATAGNIDTYNLNNWMPSDIQTAWHTYGVAIQADKIVFWIDSQVVLRVDNPIVAGSAVQIHLWYAGNTANDFQIDEVLTDCTVPVDFPAEIVVDDFEVGAQLDFFKWSPFIWAGNSIVGGVAILQPSGPANSAYWDWADEFKYPCSVSADIKFPQNDQQGAFGLYEPQPDKQKCWFRYGPDQFGSPPNRLWATIYSSAGVQTQYDITAFLPADYNTAFHNYGVGYWANNYGIGDYPDVVQFWIDGVVVLNAFPDPSGYLEGHAHVNMWYLGDPLNHIEFDNVKAYSPSPAPPPVFSLEIPITGSGWTLFASGVPGAVDWEGECWLDDGLGTTYSPPDAETAGWIYGSIYYYDGSTGLYGVTPADDVYLRNYRGYWLWSNQGSLTLNIPG